MADRQQQNMHARPRSGFTLIEVLLVAGLFAMIALGVFHALSGGLKLWQRSQHAVNEEDIAIFLDRFGQDLRQSFYFTKVVFSGESRECRFAAFVTTLADRRGSRADEGHVIEPGAVRYYFDSVDGVIYRQQANYAQAIRGTFGEPRAMVRSVKDFKLTYDYPGQSQYIGEDKAHDVIPSAVQVEVKFWDGGQERVLQQMINIPAGL